MELAAFEQMVLAMWESVPEVLREGVIAVVVSPETKLDPLMAEVVLMGECQLDPAVEYVPDAPVHSFITLYYGSFFQLSSESDAFDWEEETWGTLSHELRHHLDWRAGHDALGEHDMVQVENYARRYGLPFAPDFYLGGTRVFPDTYVVDGEAFIEVNLGPEGWQVLGTMMAQVGWRGWKLLAGEVEVVEDGIAFAEVEEVEALSAVAEAHLEHWEALTLVCFRDRRPIRRDIEWVPWPEEDEAEA